MNFLKEGKQIEIKNNVISKLIFLFFTFLTEKIKTEQNIPSHLQLSSKNVKTVDTNVERTVGWTLEGSSTYWMIFCFGLIGLFVTPQTGAHQALLSTGFSRQEYWTELPFPSPGNLPDPGIESASPSWQADSLPLSQWFLDFGKSKRKGEKTN